MMDEAGRVPLDPRVDGGHPAPGYRAQSTDQILLVLREIKDIAATGTLEERLDKLTLDTELLDLCIRIANDVHGHLEKSLGIFTGNWKGVHEIFDSVERLRLSFIEAYLDGRNRAGSSIPVILDGMTNGFSDYISQIGIYSARAADDGSRQRAYRIRGQTPPRHFRHDQADHRAASARAYHPADRGGEESRDQRRQGYRRPHERAHHAGDLRVQETRTELEDFIAGIEALTESYSASSSEDQRELERIKQGKTQFFNDMRRYQEELASLVKNFHVYPDSFQSMCAEIDAMLSELKDVVLSIEGISIHLDGFLSGMLHGPDAPARGEWSPGLADSQRSFQGARQSGLRLPRTRKPPARSAALTSIRGLDNIESGDVTLFF
jgi:hypothetical protein